MGSEMCIRDRRPPVLTVLPELSVSSLMAPNVVRAGPIIKHVFEACRIRAARRIAWPKFEFLTRVKRLYARVGGSENWSAWRLLWFPARPAFAPFGLSGVGGLDAGLFVDYVVGPDDATSLFGGDGLAVGVA